MHMMEWKPYWSSIIRDTQEFEVYVAADGTWEIADLDFGGEVRQKGRADSPDEAKVQALGAFASLVEWWELAEWQDGEYLAIIRPGRFGHDGLYVSDVRRRIAGSRVESRHGGDDTLAGAKARCRAALDELRLLTR